MTCDQTACGAQDEAAICRLSTSEVPSVQGLFDLVFLPIPSTSECRLVGSEQIETQ